MERTEMQYQENSSAPSSAQGAFPPDEGGTTSEESDNYHAIAARLNADWRVIVCAAGLQWVLQRGYTARNHGDVRWRSRSYWTSEALIQALIRCCREHAGEIEPAAWAILAALPERIDDPAPMPEAVSSR
jgi:hypothetical protein